MRIERCFGRGMGIVAPAVAALVLGSPAGGQDNGAMVEWPSFGNGPDNTKYSALDQIDRSNFHELQVAWEWESVSTGVAGANKAVKTGQFKPIPIMLDGVLYIASEVAQAAAIDAATGETLWSYDPESWRAGRPANVGFQHRGVAAWRGPVEQAGRTRDETRIFLPTHDRRLIALDGITGEPIGGFGNGGQVDMLAERGKVDFGRSVNPRSITHSSPPAVVGRISLHPVSKPDPARSNLNYVDTFFANAGGPRGLPLAKPPWGRVTAIDLNTGEHLWMTPNGHGPRAHPALAGLDLPMLGGGRGAPLLTRTLLFVTQRRGRGEQNSPRINVFDKQTGELLGRLPLPDTAHGNPITYMVGGRQYLVVALGGGSFLADLGELAADAGLDLTEEQLAAAARKTTPRLLALALP